jgi:eukaryotic-like serine/threonine-protein kinase
VLAGLLFLLANNFGGGDDSVEQVTMPLVVGEQLEAAELILADVGLEVGTPVFETSDRPENEVIASDPEAGDSADLGSTVTLTVSSGPEPVVVPDVKGMTETEATQTLVGVGFLVNPTYSENPDVEEGRVISQDPGADSEVPPNTEITIEVSSGSGTIGVPEVAGQSEGDARSALQSAGFSNISTTQEASGDVASGTVIRSSPGAGEQAPPDAAITLVVSSGAETVTVPGVQNLNEANARSALENAGLVVETAEQDVFNPGQDGQVLSQVPAANSQARRGDTVTIYIGKYREPENPGGGGGGDD